MRYQLEISESARAQLRALAREVRRNIGQRLDNLCDDLHGDVTKLKAQGQRYRLRVGSYRILFVLAGEAIQIYPVKDRKDAYE